MYGLAAYFVVYTYRSSFRPNNPGTTATNYLASVYLLAALWVLVLMLEGGAGIVRWVW